MAIIWVILNRRPGEVERMKGTLLIFPAQDQMAIMDTPAWVVNLVAPITDHTNHLHMKMECLWTYPDVVSYSFSISVLKYGNPIAANVYFLKGSWDELKDIEFTHEIIRCFLY